MKTSELMHPVRIKAKSSPDFGSTAFSGVLWGWIYWGTPA